MGQISQLTLDGGGNASVALVVQSQYQHLLNRARFYRAAPLQIDADLSGIKVETSPASAWIGGGIKLVQAPPVSGSTGSIPARSWPCSAPGMPSPVAGC